MVIKIATFLFVCVISFLLLALTVKGDVGDPLYYQNKIDTKVGGPFESTGSTSRYMLTKSIAERNSFFFTVDEARFAAPDLVRYKDKFMTVFTPGVSFLAVPFYLLGKVFNMPQFFTFLLTPLVAFFNIFLIFLVARRLGASFLASLIGGFTFAFATNAFSYAHTLTQYHLSSFVILLSIFLATLKRNIFTNFFVGLLFGIAVMFDIPNAFMLLPVLIFVGLTNFSISKIDKKIKVAFNFTSIFIVVGALLALSVYGWYNHQTTGSYTLISQNIGRSNYFDTPEKQAEDAKKLEEAIKNGRKFIPFDTRLQLESSYILLFSNERGWVYYSPVILLGFLGFALAYRKKETKTIASVIMVVILTNIVIYSMFGDPWGGWSFGARYLIPASSLLSVFLAVFLTRFRRNIVFLSIFFILFTYSAYVNSLGVHTTAAVPPKGEAQALLTQIPYTYEYNRQLATIDRASSLFYNSYLKNSLSLMTLIYITTASVSGTVLVLVILQMVAKKEKGLYE